MGRKIWVSVVLIGVFAALAYVLLFKRNEKLSVSRVEIVDGVEDANNRFALDFYSRLKDREGGNIFFSPYSVSTALAMVYEGARGKTAEEIKSVFHFPDTDHLRAGNAAALERYNRSDKKYDLRATNALWAHKDYGFLKGYFDAVGKFYRGKAVNLDFAGDPEGSRATINKWVEERTNNKIKDLISGLGRETRLIIINAVYFKGDWIEPFKRLETRPEDFRMHGGNSVKVPMMRQTNTFNYAENEVLQLLEMPYAGDALSMLVFLPKNDGLTLLEGAFNNEKLSEWRKLLKPQRVAIVIPRFKVQIKYLMNRYLIDLGMPSAFSDADFSGMDGTRSLFIDSVVHKAFVEVDENGTEAAAATGVMMFGAAAPVALPVFRADHPFIFLVQEKATGNILFLGRIVEPAS